MPQNHPARPSAKSNHSTASTVENGGALIDPATWSQPASPAFATSTLSSGQTISGQTLQSGLTLTVQSGATLIKDTTTNYDNITVFGVADSLLVQSAIVYIGGFATTSGGQASGTTVGAGGEFSLVAGSAIDTLVTSGGVAIADAANPLINTQVMAGGALEAVTTVLSATIASGGIEDVMSGLVSATTIQNGADLIINGEFDGPGSAPVVADSVIQSGGLLAVLPFPLGAPLSATVANTELQSGATLLTVPGTSITGLTIDPGAHIQHANTVVISQTVNEYFFGRVVAAGNNLRGARVGGLETAYVYSGAVMQSAFLSGATHQAFQDVFAGGTALNTTIGALGHQELNGTAIQTTIQSGGYQLASAGALARVTLVESGGQQDLTDATALVTIVQHGGTQQNHGGVASNTVLFGDQTVSSSAIATATNIQSGGVQTIGRYGAAYQTLVNNGGEQLVSGYGFDAIAAGTVIASGGLQKIATGSAMSTTIESGGMQYVKAGVVEFSTVESGGVLSDSLTDAFVSNVTLLPGAALDYPTLAFVSGATATLNSQDLLTITDGGTTVALQLQGTYTNDHFTVAPDTSGYTYVTLSAAHPASATAAATGELLHHASLAPSAAPPLPALAPAAQPPHAAPLLEPLLVLHPT